MAATGLARDVGRAFYGQFLELRPAQREAIEPVVAGRDVLVLAGTGSGKTEAVLAPLVQRWFAEMRRGTGCTIAYVTPTRALANDLLRRIEPPIAYLGLTVGVRHGERNDLVRAQKPNLLITTPESLDVLVTGRDEALRTTRGIVLDEIHLTYNTQRGFQVASLLKRLEAFTSNPCQVVGLSATVASAADIWQFFRPGHEVVPVRDEQSKPLDALIRDVPSDQALVELLNSLSLGAQAKVLLFANSRRECDRLGGALRGATGFGQNVFVHHSSLEREVRLNAERSFQEGTKGVCVATSTLELGIDIGDIDLVMLYGHPGGWESFLQRVGRGNRRSAKTNVLCLVSPNHGSRFRNVLAFEALLSQIRSGRLERERPLDIYGAAAQQLLSVVAERNGKYLRMLDLADLFLGWPHLNADAVDTLLHHFTESGHLIRHDFKNRFGAGDQLHRLRDLRLIWGNFPVRSRDVRLMASGRQIGSVPAANLMRLSAGAIVRFAGRHWRVRLLQPDYIDVEPSRSTVGIDVTYGGTAGRSDPTIAEEMLRLLERGIDSPAAPSCVNADFRASADRMRPHVGQDRLPVTRDAHGHYYHFTFGGRLLNEVIARWAGLDVYEAGEIVLRTRQRLDLSALPDDLRALTDVAALALQVPADLTAFQSLLPAEMLQRELADVWLKTTVHQRSVERLRQSRLKAAPFEDLAPLCD
jgi:ATP-dependent Lhr-like helicase